MPIEFNKNKLMNFNSDLFTINKNIENFTINSNSDGQDWYFSDKLIKEEIPHNLTSNDDIIFTIVNVPLELNWYSRRLEDNKIVITFHEIKEMLLINKIPLENLIYYLLYAYILAYTKYNKRIPLSDDFSDLIHDETKGCLFDMHGIKTDVIYSCNKPILCDSCVNKLKESKLSQETIKKVQSEILVIKKDLFYRMMDFIKKHPIWALVISGVSAIILGAIGSIIGSSIYDIIKPK